MKKTFKRLITFLMAITMLFGTFGAMACTPSEDLSNTTVIRIMSHGGGYGRVWLDMVCNQFSASVKDKEYAAGKKGVKFKIESTLDVNTATMNTSGYALYFTGSGLSTRSLAAKGSIMEIDNIVTETITDEKGQSYSIESLIMEDYRDIFKVNGKYYGLPHFSDHPGISYDVENFIKGGFYLADDTDSDTTNEEVFNSQFGQATFLKANSKQQENWGKKSVGSDGIAGTEDDGLPSSMVEFLIMCDRMKSRGCTPMQISGQHIYYILYFIEAIWAGLGGYDEMSAVLNSDGKMIVVDTDDKENILFTEQPLFTEYDYEIGEDGDGNETVKQVVNQAGDFKNIKMPKTKEITVTSANKNRINDSFAKYVAFSLIEIMNGKGWFSSATSDTTCNHIAAQRGFVCNDLATAYEKVGMFCDGTYWYNEAKDNRVMSTYTQLSKKKEKLLGYMSMPTHLTDKVTGEENARDLVVFGSGVGGLFVNKRFAEDKAVMDACKDFIQFAYTKQALIDRFASSGIYMLGIDYNAIGIKNDPNIDTKLSNWQKSFFNVITSAKLAPTNGSFAESAFYPSIDGKKYTSILTAIRIGKNSKVCFENARSIYGDQVV